MLNAARRCRLLLELRPRHVRLPSCGPSPLWTISSPFLYRQWLTFPPRLQVNQISCSDVPPSKCDNTKVPLSPPQLPPPPAALRTSPSGRLELNEHVSDRKVQVHHRRRRHCEVEQRGASTSNLRCFSKVLTLFVQFGILLVPPVLLLPDFHFLPTPGTQ